MNTLIQESPAVYVEGKAKDVDQVIEEFASSFFYFRVELPSFSLPTQGEMSDEDLLLAADAAGTFRFLDDTAENSYQP